MKNHFVLLFYCFLLCSLTGLCDAEVVVSCFPPNHQAVTARSSGTQDATTRVKYNAATTSSPSRQAATISGAAEFLRQVRASASFHRSTVHEACTSPVTNPVKLDFIPAADRRDRSERGYTRINTPPGAYGVEGHGSPGHMTSRDGSVLNEKELAKWILRDPRYRPGMTVYLFACDTGKGRRPFAQDLANVLCTTVVAPTERLWIHRNGSYSVAAAASKRLLGIVPYSDESMDEMRPGTMKIFRPSLPMTAAQPKTLRLAASSPTRLGGTDLSALSNDRRVRGK